MEKSKTNIRRERVRQISCRITPSHQSDINDTLMCKFIVLAGKEDIVHGDCHYADYHRDYRISKKQPLTIIKSFEIDIQGLLEEGGSIESMENKVIFNLPTTTTNKGTRGNVKFCQFPLFVCEFKEDGKMVDINCFVDYKNRWKDLDEYKKEYPDLI